MKKLTVQQKTTITGGYAWDKIALCSIATSVTVSLISNVLNIINSTKTKAINETMRTNPAKIYGANTTLISKLF